MVKVDRAQCQAVADLLRGVTIPEDREDTSLPGIPRAALPNFLLLVVAICHQTTPATGEAPLEGWVDGKPARGWDYLLRRLAAETGRDARWVDAAAWQTIDAADLRSALHDARNGDRLTDPEGRAALIRNLGETMRERGWLDASAIHRLCGGRVEGQKPNLVSELGRFHAYRDPVRKKTYYFLALMRNFGLWTYADDADLGPPADYHEVRGHLRIGTVRVDDPMLVERLMKRQRVSVEEDNAIRACVVDAITSIARDVGVTPSSAHYMFWNLFRNICTRERPQCFHLLPDNPLPARYTHLTALVPSGSGCPFAAVCQSAGREPMPQDPVVVTDFH